MPAPAPPPPPLDFRELLHDGSDGGSPPEGEWDRDVGSAGDREPPWKCEASSLLLPQAPLIPIRGVWGIEGRAEWVLDEWLMEMEDEGFRPRLSRVGGPLLLPIVERRRGRLVGATMDGWMGGREGGGFAFLVVVEEVVVVLYCIVLYCIVLYGGVGRNRQLDRFGNRFPFLSFFVSSLSLSPSRSYPSVSLSLTLSTLVLSHTLCLETDRDGMGT